MNLPDYNFLSAPLWLMSILHVLTLTLHLIAMNFLFGSLVFIIVARLKDKWDDPTVKKLIKFFPNLMAATVTLGVAPLLFVQLVYAEQIYSASIVSGWFWLLIFVVAIIAYYMLYGASFSKIPGKGNRYLYLVIAFIGMLYISFIYSSVFSMAENPNQYQTLYIANQSGWSINPNLFNYIFRWLHVLFGAVTIGSFFVSWFAKDNENIFKVVKKFFIFGMIMAMVFGLLRLMTLGDVMVPLMRSPAIWLITIGLLFSLGALHLYTKKKYLITAVLLFISMVCMVTTRHITRLLFLEGEFDPSTITVTPQWTVIILFLIFFVIAIAVIWYMLRLFFVKPA